MTIWVKLQEAGKENGPQTSHDAQLTCEEVDYILLNEKVISNHFSIYFIGTVKKFTKHLLPPIIEAGVMRLTSLPRVN